MHLKKLTVLIIVLFAAAQLSLRTDRVPPVKGHFTRRDKLQTVWLDTPKLTDDGQSCVNGDCIATLHFADPAIPSINIKSCIGGTPVNLGDLDNDGLDEIGLLPEWFTSCWRNYYVYTFKHGHWENAVPPITTHCNQWEADLKPIVKSTTHKGYVKITYSTFENNAIVFKTKEVAVK